MRDERGIVRDMEEGRERREVVRQRKGCDYNRMEGGIIC